MKRILSFLLKMVKNNWPLKIAALIFAFILWSYAMVETNPVKLMYVDNVVVSVIGVEQIAAKNLVVSDDIGELVSTVRVSVDAEQTLHKRINSDNVKATIDLSSINSAGEAEIKITVDSTYGIVRSVSPSSVKLNIEDLVTRQVPVSVTTTGTPAEGYYVKYPELQPSVIKVSGAKTIVERITEAKVYIDVSNLSTSIREAREITLFDQNGDVIDSVGIVGGVPTVVANVEVLPQKTLEISDENVRKTITGVPDGYEITGIEINPGTLDVAAPQDILENVTALVPEPIDVKSATSSVLVTAEFNLPDGAMFVKGSTAEVYVQISEMQSEREFKNVQIEVINDGKYSIASSVKRTDVTVSGGKSKVAALKADDLRLYIDVSNLTPGSYVIPVSFDQLDGIKNADIKLEYATVTVTVK